MKHPPTAILVSEAVQTFGLYRKLGEAGLEPGRDISVLGLLPEDRVRMLSPALTLFVTDWAAVGTQLGEALIDALAGGAAMRGKSKPRPAGRIAPIIFERASTHEVRLAQPSLNCASNCSLMNCRNVRRGRSFGQAETHDKEARGGQSPLLRIRNHLRQSRKREWCAFSALDRNPYTGGSCPTSRLRSGLHTHLFRLRREGARFAHGRWQSMSR